VQFFNGQFSCQGLNLVYGGSFLRVWSGCYCEFKVRPIKLVLWEDETYLPGLVKKGKNKAISLQAWKGSDGARRLMFPDLMTVGT